MSILEAIMLICFGAAWPVSMFRSYRSRSTKGKSVVFSYVVLAGYVSGIAFKILYNPDFVLWLYLLNFVMVFADMMFWYRNRAIERREEAENAAAGAV